jgi:hypothetical protein
MTRVSFRLPTRRLVSAANRTVRSGSRGIVRFFADWIAARGDSPDGQAPCSRQCRRFSVCYGAAPLSVTDDTIDIRKPATEVKNLARDYGFLAEMFVHTGALFMVPEFQRQSVDFVAAFTEAGKPVRLLLTEGYKHFEFLETLASPYGLLGRAELAQMRLGYG